MVDLRDQSARYFKTYEERESAFRKSAFSLIPRKYLGPGPFWSDFRRISLDGFSKISQEPVAFITSNPRDCLSFGTPQQVLAAACLCAEKAGHRFDLTVGGIAESFGISANLEQPVRTLSGGETVKLALAKSYAAAAYATRLAISSPFSWLSRDNAALFDRLFHAYRRRQLPVEIFALEGENSDRPIDEDERCRWGVENTVDFTLKCRGVRIRLGTSFNTLYSHRTLVTIHDISADLSSPCLLVGANGQGKSLVARVLAGAVASQGVAEIAAGSTYGRVRLLFQDVIAQTLLRSFKAIAGPDDDVRILYRQILDAFDALTGTPHGRQTAGEAAMGGRSGTLLGIKTLLVAVRLCHRPGALILDEPDWGMSRSDAIAFVAAIIRVAHARGVPVLIISHKPWWLPVTRSVIGVRRTGTRPRGDRQSTFAIRLRPQPGGGP